ncbi:MAG: DNA recombination protein RmuC [Methyloversatilis sp.]|uniref:DNA recombination protein RmuC n=1 Tax=Methyloversatilis sp. TaxID=2569862 RepID=UPI0027363679|nr:DNA recombination protein RmuC [Methyloversatilis sp.]MDP3871468.1 DNA recombination protein RmuC [Methyloversatilis sp.]
MPVSLTDSAILIALLGAALLGGALSAIWLRSRTALEIERAQAERVAQLLTAQERLRAASLDIDRLRAELKVSGAVRATLDLQLQQEKAARVRAETQAQRIPALEQALAEGAAQRQALAEAVAGLRIQLDAERSQTTEKLALLDAAREQMGLQFQEVANRILEEKSQRFTQQNHDNLGLLLNPLNEKIKAFQDQVAQTYDRESKERLTLKNEIERLALLNTRISEDAVNLTQALKGSNKSQGIWGEMVLEKVLESSGLRRGHEYVAEESYAADDGNRRRPDVVVQLPEGRHMIIDAKMSLLGYERYCSADNDAARALAQREHVQSIRAHIKGLSDKNYPMLDGLKAPDFVLMFVPVEPAFMLAATSDNTLFEDAFSRNVLLVSPSTLLAVLRMVANVWRQESQGRNAQLIAEQGARLYDKFVGFVEDLEEIGKRIDQTQKAYQDAHGKLSSGRGNLVRQVENLRRLGVKPARQLRAGLLPDEAALEGPPPDPEHPG